MTEGEWLTSDKLSFLRQCLFRKVDPVSTRKVRLFVVACCRRIWPLLTDERSRRAVEMAEALADGGVPKADASMCRKAARAVSRELYQSRAGPGLAMAARAAEEIVAPSRQEVGRAADHAATAVASAQYYGTGGA